MPLFGRNALRRNALERLATLSAYPTASQDEKGDLENLYQLRTPAPQDGVREAVSVSAIPMTTRELDVLMALCKAAPLVQATADATSLLRQLAPYVPEAHRQALKESPVYQHLPPWDSLAYHLTTAVLSLAVNHASLRVEALSYIDGTIDALAESIEKATARGSLQANGHPDPDIAKQSLPIIQLTVSLLGFLHAVADHVRAWPEHGRLKVVQRLRAMLSEKFMIAVEGALSAVRNARVAYRAVKEWKRWMRHYASTASPLGAVVLQQAFMRVIEASVTLLALGPEPVEQSNILDTLLAREQTPVFGTGRVPREDLEQFLDLIAEELSLLNAEADYLLVSTAWQQRLALEVKASSLRSFLFCALVEPELADSEMFLSWLDGVAADTIQMSDDGLAQTVLKCMGILASTSKVVASSLSRSIPRLIVQGTMTPHTAQLAGKCLAHALRELSEDAVISTLYSLGNVLSAGGSDKVAGASSLLDGTVNIQLTPGSPMATQSAISLSEDPIEGRSSVYCSVVQAIVAIASLARDEKITALVISMLAQKIGRISHAVDATVIVETATVGVCGGIHELRSLLRIYARIASEATIHHIPELTTAVMEARVRLALSIRKDSPLFETYMLHLLSICVSGGDTASGGTVDAALASQIISQTFRPLAILVSADSESKPTFENEEELLVLSRDAWFNIVVHGFWLTSPAGKKHARDLQTLAQYTLPLVDEHRADMPESGVDLNTVLRRGSSPQSAVEQKSALIAALPQAEGDIRGLSYADCVFLNAALLVTTLRARGGDCTAALPYFLESKVKNGPMSNCMSTITLFSVDTYLSRAVEGKSQIFAAPHIALQLATFFEGCCHRIPKVQQAAMAAADRIVAQIPSSLCQKASLFGLLELLNLMWQSCLDCETDEYDWKSRYRSAKGNVTITLSDNVEYREHTLTTLHKRARQWVGRAIDWAPLDVKSLLQAYLEDYEDDGAYGHIALGRSFAVEMGSMIPHSDQRLVSLSSQQELGVNTASDFIAQYTTRQQYRHVDVENGADDDWTIVGHNGLSLAPAVPSAPQAASEAHKLQELAQRLRKHDAVPFPEIRSTLRNAAGVLSKTAKGQTPIIQHLVAIPFIVFTKAAINLGVSVWLGIIKENPTLESRVLAEVAAGWEQSIRLQKGFFNPNFVHLDPFYIRKEFAPSKWEAISARQQHAHNYLAPHLRLTHLLSSHFSSTRLTSPHIESIYTRLIWVTLLAMKDTVRHPLARELHFHLVLLALRLLKLGACLDAQSQRRLKDAIISAGLSWFASPPKWSFGSNKLQIKAEVKLLNDVCGHLQGSPNDNSRANGLYASTQSRQELLVQLIQQEIIRLTVWITPLSGESKGIVASLSQAGATVIKDSAFVNLISTAWREDPRIAIYIAARFPSSSRIRSEVRGHLLREPEKAIHIPDALPILLGDSLPTDVNEQLRYLLFWAPVNPIGADTYFLPAYGNHALIIQYAMRALESHSVDITFFYVPQIVQTLRYDALGYVERYIIETARFSQLFAHQIIWNMKANSYKDDDAQIPDAVKPILDKVTDVLISSFSVEDRVFYHREFDFFGKITGISGTLKPFIKRPKPEKKQKIEEELRKIEVEVGVYLPSNPDGVVIGIDRKSGKPLQSHAKAPYMATFRVRKEEKAIDADTDEGESGRAVASTKSIEVWQSAIFKVGDDCRQDLLALQLIAAFRGIFNQVGLDVYVFPYRVTATAPGCGVIDVLPNSISRDMLGREAVNGLYEYFVSKYGSEDSIRFQVARSNFIKSMAAYSIISYLLQFKDRHNGNIMIDDAGHILHIDFGFCFDIAPGGVKFERAPFKLSPEMVAVMGGSTQSAPFKAFEELCVKAFLSARQYVHQLSHIIETMLDSGLPCFKPTSLQHFKERFVLEKSDREAADFVRKLVHWSERSYSTGVYDYFQLLTNGIPY